MDPVAVLVAMLAPPRCGACDDPCAAQSALCEACESALQAAGGGRAPVAGVGEVVWAAPYSAVARDLVTELKFGVRLRLADVAAGALAAALGADLVRRPIVPVPAAPARRRARGFDPAEEIARALAARTGTEIRLCLARADGPRQVGRRARGANRDPPRVRVTAEPPRRRAARRRRADHRIDPARLRRGADRGRVGDGRRGGVRESAWRRSPVRVALSRRHTTEGDDRADRGQRPQHRGHRRASRARRKALRSDRPSGIGARVARGRARQERNPSIADR